MPNSSRVAHCHPFISGCAPYSRPHSFVWRGAALQDTEILCFCAVILNNLSTSLYFILMKNIQTDLSSIGESLQLPVVYFCTRPLLKTISCSCSVHAQLSLTYGFQDCCSTTALCHCHHCCLCSFRHSKDMHGGIIPTGMIGISWYVHACATHTICFICSDCLLVRHAMQ